MEHTLKELADRFAELKGAEVLASRFAEADNALVFVLSSGPKLKMNERELRTAIEKLEPKPMRTKPVAKANEVVAERETKSKLASTKAN